MLADPLSDDAFKFLLGTEENKDLLIDFLNSVLRPEQPIVEVVLLDPTSLRAYSGQRSNAVDVKARDAAGRWFQVEVQRALHPAMEPRMLFGWSATYRNQAVSGDAYETLLPVTAIWLLKPRLFKDLKGWHHHFEIRDPRSGRLLTDHLSIHVIELAKWRPPAHLDPEDRWLYFFKEAGHWEQLPAAADAPPQRKAMAALKQFTEHEIAWMREESRLDKARVKDMMEREYERMRLENIELREQLKTASDGLRSIAEQSQQLAEQSQQVAEQNRQLAEQNRQLAEQNRQLAAQNGRLTAQNEEMNRKLDQLLALLAPSDP